MPTSLPIDLLASSDLGSSSTDNLTNDDTPTLEGFAGVALFGATVDFTSDLDGFLGSTTVGADGIWQMTLPQISQGNNWITATITAPDTSVTTETIKLGIDTYAVISIDQPIGTINEAFTISGTTVGVENGRTVTLVLTDSDGETVGLTTTVSAKVWQVDVSQARFNALDLGSVSIDVSTSDRAGNIAQANNVVDFTGIDLLSTSDSGSSSTDNLTNDDTPTLEGFAGVALFGATVDFTSDLDGALGSTTVGVDGYWQMTLPELNDGNHIISATIYNPDSSVLLQDTLTLGIDTTAVINIDQLEDIDGGWFDLSGTTSGVNTGVLLVVLTDENGVTLSKSQSIASMTWFLNFPESSLMPLAEGVITIDVSITDKAGNTAINSTSVMNTLFEMSLSDASNTGSHDDTVTMDTTPTFEGPAGSAVSGSTITVYSNIDGALIGEGLVDADGSWLITTPELSEGDHNLTFTFTALTGRIFTTTTDITIFTDSNISIDRPDNIADSTLTGVVNGVESGEDVTLTFIDVDGNTAQTTAQVTSDSHWSSFFGDVLHGLTPGTIQVKAESIDALGATVTDSEALEDLPTFFWNPNTYSELQLANGDWIINTEIAGERVYEQIDSLGNILNTQIVDINGSGITTSKVEAVGESGSYAVYRGTSPTIFDSNGQQIIQFDSSASRYSSSTYTTENGFVFIDEDWSEESQAGSYFDVEHTQTYSFYFLDANGQEQGFYKIEAVSGATIDPGPWPHYSWTSTYTGVYGYTFKDLIFESLENDNSLIVYNYGNSYYESGDAASLSDNIRIRVFSPTGDLIDTQLITLPEGVEYSLDSSSVIKDGEGWRLAGGQYEVAYNFDGTQRDFFLWQESDTGASSLDGLTYITTPVVGGFSGSADYVGETIEIVSDTQGLVATTTIDANGFWQATLLALTKGSHSLTGTITSFVTPFDLGSVSITIDTQAALDINITPADTLVLNGEGFTLQGTATDIDEGSIVKATFYDVNGDIAYGEGVVTADTWSLDVNFLSSYGHWRFAPGVVDVDVFVYDHAGNRVDTEGAFSFNINTEISASLSVNPVIASNTRPWLSGTFDADNIETLTVTVDGKTYTLGEDSNLFQHANNTNIWVLKPQGFYHLGEHDVVVQATDASGNIAMDQTTGELTITRDMFAPAINGSKQIYNARPAVGGSFDEAATKTLTVELDGTVYTLGVDAELTSQLNNRWVLDLSTLTTPLLDGVYDVIATTTDANNVTLQDASTGELTIGMLAPTVNELETTNFKPALSGFYDADFANELTVTVNGNSYTLGVDSELTTHVNNDSVWVLNASQRLNFGDNDIQVTATDTKGKDKTDTTTDEIHIYQIKSQAVNGDVLITQEGNDIITINDNTFTQIDTGLGTDTLVLAGDVINLDFANIQGIDVVDLSDAASTTNTLTLTLNDVLTSTDNSSLSVLGDGADTVTLATADNWAAQGSQIINGTTFDTYDSGAASLLIEQGVAVQVV